MNEIGLFSGKIIQGEVLLIFSQVLLIMGNEDYGATQDYPDLFGEDGVASEELVRLNIQNMPTILQPNQLVSEFLTKGQTKQFYYLMTSGGYAWSITVIPCTANIYWVIRHRNENNTGKLYNPKYPEDIIVEYRGGNTRTFSTYYAAQGLYTIQATPLDQNTYVQFYTTLEPRGPKLLQLERRTRTVRFKKRERKNKLGIRWSSSDIDSHLIKYVIVVNTKKFYKSVCEAQTELAFSFPRPQKYHSKNAEIGITTDNDLTVQSTGRATNYTMKNMVFGKRYYVNIFAINVTELSVPYANASILYDKSKPRGLKDGKPATGSIKANNGHISFRYKVSKRLVPGFNNEILLYVLPCGGLVNVEVRHKKKVIIPKQRVSGYGKFIVMNPIRGDRYVIKINALSPDELQYFKRVEVFATMRPKLYPLPDLPSELKVQEYTNLQDCTSITIGWSPVQNSNETPITYCVYVKEDNHIARGNDWNKKPDQCNLDLRNKKMKSEFILAQCKQVVPTNSTVREVITQKILNLNADQDYILQVTARKPGYKSLSYDLLSVHKNNLCN